MPIPNDIIAEFLLHAEKGIKNSLSQSFHEWIMKK